jgi:hypothetical protein
MSLTDDIESARLVFEEIVSNPIAARAIRLFGERVLAGESIPEALLKTGEIFAAEASLSVGT